MKIGGLQPVTILDYPGKMAAIVFTAGCNMRCPFCYNFQLVLPEYLARSRWYDEDKVIDFLFRRKKYLDGLVLSGGEPTLQPDLPQFLAKMKKIGYDIKLDTNGYIPEMLSRLIKDKLVDYIALDIKGPLGSYEKFTGVSAEPIKKSIELVISSGLPYEFRSTLVKGLHDLKSVEAMAKAIKGVEKYYLQNYSDQSPLAGERFKGQPFTRRELEEFCIAAKKFVKHCEIR
jgi:pyruvate formate lyase activating enzyme